MADGQTVGLVTVHRINQVPAGERGQTTLRDVACSLSEVARATPDEPVADVLPRLNTCSEGRALVFADGHLAGIVAPADMSRHPGTAQQHPRPVRLTPALSDSAGCGQSPGSAHYGYQRALKS